MGGAKFIDKQKTSKRDRSKRPMTKKGQSMVYTDYIKQHILHHYYINKCNTPTITKVLQEEGLKANCVGIAKFLKRYKDSSSLVRKPGSGRPSKITAELKKVIEGQMQFDDEMTTYLLHQLLVSKGFNISLRTVLRCRTSLGWTLCRSAYCQLIREVNKAKWLQWAIVNQDLNFDDVVWMDKCTVHLESHRRFCSRKVRQRPKNKPR